MREELEPDTVLLHSNAFDPVTFEGTDAVQRRVRVLYGEISSMVANRGSIRTYRNGSMKRRKSLP